MKTMVQQRNGTAVSRKEPDSPHSCGQCTADRADVRTEKAFVINEPFRGKQFAANLKLADQERRRMEEHIPAEETLVFVVVGDLNIKSKYASTFLAVTDKTIYGFDESLPGGVKQRSYDQIRRAFVKRCYGNALLVFSMDDSGEEYVDYTKEHENFLRFSYKVASLYDAAAFFIQNVAAGKLIEDEVKVLEAAFEKQFCICPQCGRSLIRPGAPCMNCQSKGKVAKKLAAYVLPYKYLLLLCIFLSIITTAVSLLPPYMTKMLVDDVLPAGNRHMLLVCVGILLGAYLIQYGVGAVRSYLLRISGDKIVADLRNDVYQKAQMLTMRFYDRRSTGSVINRISGDTANIQSFMLRITQEVVVQFFLLIGIVVIMFFMNWQLTLLSLIPVPFVVVGAKIFGKKIAPYYRRIWRRW